MYTAKQEGKKQTKRDLYENNLIKPLILLISLKSASQA